MRLSLEGFGEEFEIGKIAFELEDLKKDKEKRREKIGDFAGDLGFRERGIYISERGRKGGAFWIVWRRNTKGEGKTGSTSADLIGSRAILLKDWFFQAINFGMSQKGKRGFLIIRRFKED